MLERMEQGWGKGVLLSAFAQSLANNASAREWWARFQRQASSLGAAVAVLRMDYEIDVRPILSANSSSDSDPAPHRRSHGATRARTLSRTAHPGSQIRGTPRHGSLFLHRKP